jgi:amino acid transporter
VGISGMILLIGYTYAAPSLDAAAASPTPVLTAIEYQWGPVASQVLNLVFLVSFFSAILLAPAAAGRILYSMARDNVLPFSGHFSGVHPKFQTPARALVVVGVSVVVIFTVPAILSPQALTYILGTASVGYNLVYWGMTGIFFVIAAKKSLPEQHGKFSLGRWALPISGIAFVWQTFLIYELTLTDGNRQVGLTTLIIFAISLVWYVMHIRKPETNLIAGTTAVTGDDPTSTRPTQSAQS